MARLYLFDCFECGEKEIELVEYVVGSDVRQSDNNKFVVNLEAEIIDSGYPPKTKLCIKCKTPVVGYPEQTNRKALPVYFNYMGND